MNVIPDKDELTEKLNELINKDYVLSTRWIIDEKLDKQPELIWMMSVKCGQGVTSGS